MKKKIGAVENFRLLCPRDESGGGAGGGELIVHIKIEIIILKLSRERLVYITCHCSPMKVLR